MKNKINRRKYFVGNKKLKHVKLFENFDRMNEDYRSDVAKFGITIEDITFDGQPIKRWTIGKDERFQNWEHAMDWLVSQWKKNEDLFDFFRTNLSIKDDVVVGNYEFAANDVMDHMRWAKNESAMNEVKAEAVADRKLRVTKEFAKQIEEMVNLSQQFQKIEEEYKAMAKILGKYEDEVQKVLEGYGAQFIRIGKIAIELKKIKGRETKSYKEIADALEKLLPVNKEMQKKIKDIEEMHTKINPDKIKMVYSVEEGWLSNMAKAVGSWFTNLWQRLKEGLPKFKKDVDELEAAVEKIKA